MTIVDSSVLVDWLRGDENAATAWLDDHLDRETLGLADVVLFEVLRGATSDRLLAEVEEGLRNFTVYDTGGRERARQAAMDYRRLRAYGKTVRSPIDCIVASFCIQEGHQLLHTDRDFDGYERHLGLRVVRP